VRVSILEHIEPFLIEGRYYYDGRVHVIPEFDGVRLLTNESCEFLHKVSGMYTFRGGEIVSMKSNFE
jgi:hypothetical protein